MKNLYWLAYTLGLIRYQGWPAAKAIAHVRKLRQYERQRRQNQLISRQTKRAP